MNRDRTLLALGAFGPALFVVVFLVEGALRPGYSAWHHYVSELSLGPGGAVQVANFLVDAALTLVLAFALRPALGGTRAGAWTTALVAVNGLALVGLGLFSTDPALGYPPGAASTATTTSGMVHSVVGLAAFLSLGAAPIVLSRRFARADGAGAWRGWAPYSLASGVGVLAFFAAATVAGALDAGGEVHDAPVGLLQRASIVLGNAWIVALALRLRSVDAP